VTEEANGKREITAYFVLVNYINLPQHSTQPSQAAHAFTHSPEMKTTVGEINFVTLNLIVSHSQSIVSVQTISNLFSWKI